MNHSLPPDLRALLARAVQATRRDELLDLKLAP